MHTDSKGAWRQPVVIELSKCALILGVDHLHSQQATWAVSGNLDGTICPVQCALCYLPCTIYPVQSAPYNLPCTICPVPSALRVSQVLTACQAVQPC